MIEIINEPISQQTAREISPYSTETLLLMTASGPTIGTFFETKIFTVFPDTPHHVGPPLIFPSDVKHLKSGSIHWYLDLDAY